MHVEKYTKNAVGHMLQHYNRTAAHNGNRDIEVLRTSQNYNLCQRAERDIIYFKKRLGEVKCQNRSDVKVLCDWIVTLPKAEFTESEEHLFFKTAYTELCRRYGELNTVSAWVHKDECGQPHLHFCFIPVCVDRNKGIEKVSAKEVLTRTELRAIHKEMSEVMERAFGRNVGICNGATANGNKTILELKNQGLQEENMMLDEMKQQRFFEVTTLLKKKPKLIGVITTAVRAAMGHDEMKRSQSRCYERSR